MLTIMRGLRMLIAVLKQVTCDQEAELPTVDFTIGVLNVELGELFAIIVGEPSKALPENINCK